MIGGAGSSPALIAWSSSRPVRWPSTSAYTAGSVHPKVRVRSVTCGTSWVWAMDAASPRLLRLSNRPSLDVMHPTASPPAALEWSLETCTIGRAMEILGEKWTVVVLREVFNGVRRFDDM